jgi:hypothetical protein
MAEGGCHGWWDGWVRTAGVAVRLDDISPLAATTRRLPANDRISASIVVFSPAPGSQRIILHCAA